MRVESIGTYSSLTCRNSGAVKQEPKVVQAAIRELRHIQEQGKQAGTDSAWWRTGFEEAKLTLEAIVRGDTPPESYQKSSLMSFHDFNDDGFI